MATILIVDDDAGLRDGLAEAIGDLGHRPQTAATGGEALAHLASHHVDAVLLDLRMPGGVDGIDVLRKIRARSNSPPVAVLTAYASAENTIEAMRLGAFDHLTKPIGRDELSSLLVRMLPRRGAMADGDIAPEQAVGALIGASEGMRRVQKTIGLAADSDATVLILGETGTGKELVARALHEHSRREAKPFVAVNCAAIPSDLLESELFGHVKGAFTGAGTDRPGAFRDADGGTLFLDEIGDMPLPMQAKILRVLQERVLTPVGGKPATVDVRVVAATHRDLTSVFGCVPRRPVLPVERGSDRVAASQGAACGHRAAGRAFSALVIAGRDAEASYRQRGRAPARLFLAGQRARDQERHRAGECARTRRNH
jgi:DNA-binding NtrC family response regulator